MRRLTIVCSVLVLAVGCDAIAEDAESWQRARYRVECYKKSGDLLFATDDGRSPTYTSKSRTSVRMGDGTSVEFSPAIECVVTRLK